MPLTRSPKRALLLVDHGSRSAEANRVVAKIARGLRRRLRGWVVEVAHLDVVAPTIADGIAACAAAGATDIVVHPFFLAPGLHARRDVPREARAAARRLGVRVRVTAPLGAEPALVDVILARIDAV